MVFTGVVTISAGIGATAALLLPFQSSSTSAGGETSSIGDLFRSGFQYGVSRPVNLLVMGIDQGIDSNEERNSTDVLSSRSDTMLVVRLNPETRKTSVLTIPRDTQVEIPGLGVSKINAANWKGGSELASQVVSQTLNGMPIDRYVRISTNAFREIVDVMGGVEVYVPKRMYYVDQTQKLNIDLQPGLQTLNGLEAEGFVRFRNDDLGDIGRTQRQQMLLKALQKKFDNPLMITRLPQIFSVLQKHLDSNLSFGEMLALIQFGMQSKTSDLQMALLPGRFSSPEEFELSYWIMDRTATDQVLKSYFQVEPPITDEASIPADLKAVTIVVQNASGDPGAADRMVDHLQQLGFPNLVLATEDWSETLDKTQVVPQWGNLDAAKGVEELLGSDDSEVTADSTGDLQSDLTVRVGRQWAERSAAGTNP
ncbi:MAG: LCP family protein [Thermosynechococcaceae cyanobacterium MS004]|nr:LCP family protein [Thermosynechococcaceae cyanobacterium MS004]